MGSNSEVVGGVDTYVLFKEEIVYGTPVIADTAWQGLIGSATYDIDRGYQESPGFAGTLPGDGRVTKKTTPGVVTVTGSIDFKPQRFDFLQYVLLGTRTGSGTIGSPYVYTVGTDTRSLTVTEEIDNVGTDSERVFSGMVIDACTLRCATGEAMQGTLSLKGGRLSKNTTVSAKVANLTDDLYHFAGSTLEMPDATPIGNIVESVEISVNNNYTLKYGQNEEAQNAKPGKLNLSVRFTLNYLDDDQLTQLMGSSTAITTQTAVTLTMNYTKPDGSYAKFRFANVYLTRDSESHTLNEFVVENIDALPQNLTVTEVQS